MEHPGFFERAAPMPVHVLADRLGGKMGPSVDPATPIRDVRPLSDAGRGDLAFFENRKYLAQLDATRASACLVAPAFLARVPEATAALIVDAPYRAFAQALALFYPDAMHPKAAMTATGDPPVHPSAVLEEGVRIEAGAVVGREAQIGRGTVVA